MAQEGEHLLRAFRFKRVFDAEKGVEGQGKNRFGRGGKTTVVIIPVGTVVSRVVEGKEREFLGELMWDRETLVAAKGGRGGWGNTHFADPENRAPLLAESGEEGERAVLELEVKLLADVGIIGVPGVGKSSFMRVATRAMPEVAAYPFTTLEPVLGYVDGGDEGFTIVEIPGLIRGAHRGAGLGYEFLRHMERTKGVVHLLDGSSQDIVGDYQQVREEMELYNSDLVEKPEIIAVNKIDLPEVQERIQAIAERLKREGLKAHWISALTGQGVSELLDKARGMVEQRREKEERAPSRVPKVKSQPARDRPSVERSGEVFVVRSSRAERLVTRVDLEDRRVQVQLWRELQRIGVVRALEREGARAGALVRIGEKELEWK